MIGPHRPARRGYNLIEMMVVITVVGVLLGLCAMTMQALFRVSADAQSRRVAAGALDRLAEQFREDVHACSEAEVRSAVGLRLRRDPRVVIDYEARGNRVTRVESVEGQAGRHESYELGRHDTAAFGRRDDGPRRFVALVVDRREHSPKDPAHPVEVLASVGQDRTLTTRPGGGPPR